MHKRVATELYSQSLVPISSRKIQEAVVEGVSMWPHIRPGYRVSFRAVHPEVLSPGDVIVLRSKNRRGEPQACVHRLVGRVGPLFLEAGDNTFVASLVRAEDVLGRVEEVRDWNGKRVPLPRSYDLARFRYFLWCARSFMFAHELKDRVVGGRKSRVLWQASRAYRWGLGTLGLEVPAIFPSH